MSEPSVLTIGAGVDHSVVIVGTGNTVTIYSADRHMGSLVPAIPTMAGALGANPYRGLSAFQAEDHDVFYGREALTEKLVVAIANLFGERAPVRLLTVLGPSGSGKSSVVRAGLLPAIAKRPSPGWRSLRVALMTPTESPLTALGLVLAQVATGDVAPVRKGREFAEEMVRRAPDGRADGLSCIATSLSPGGDSPLLLVVDQVEEIYALCRDERAIEARDLFVENLITAAGDSSSRIAVLLAMRSDFFGETVRHPALSRTIADQHLLVPAMTGAELRTAIEEPAYRAGRPLDALTVDRLLRDVEGREGALPLLEFALTAIWDGLGQGVAAHNTIAGLNGVGGAVAARAQEVYDRLDESERSIARRAFLGMVQLGEGVQDTRRRAALRDLVASGEDDERVRVVLRRFADPGARLVTLSAQAVAGGTGGAVGRDGGLVVGAEGSSVNAVETAEVTHEALFHHWRQLREWIDSGRDDLRFHRRVAEAARNWDEWRRKGDADGSLWRPPDLDLLREFVKRAGSDLTPVQWKFVKAAERRQRAEEEERLRRAEEETRRIDEERKRAVADRRRARAVAAGAVVAAMVFGGLGWWAWKAQVNANRAKVEADRASEDAKDRLARFLEEQGRRELLAGHPARALAYLRQPLHDRAGSATAKFLVARALAMTVDAEPTQPLRHDEKVFAASFSPDGKRIVTACRDKMARIWDAQTGVLLATLQGHTEGGLFQDIHTATFSADGTRVVTASDDYTARLWDSRTGTVIAVLEGHTRGLHSAYFDMSGERIITASSDKTARLWDSRSGAPLATLYGHAGDVNSAAFSRDGTYAVTASEDGTAGLWDLDAGKLVFLLKGHAGGVRSASFSPDGRLLVTAGEDKTARIWSRETGMQLATVEGHTDSLIDASFSPDGSHLLTFGYDNTPRLSDPRTGKLLHALIGHSNMVRSAFFAPRGDMVATASEDGTVRLWSVRLGTLMATFEAHSDSVWSVAFNADGSRVLSASWDHTARQWSTRPGGMGLVLDGHTDEVGSAAFNSDGTRVVTASDDGSAGLWDASSGRLVARLMHSGRVTSASFSTDGQHVVTSSADGTSRIWSAFDGNGLIWLMGHTDLVWKASFSPDGELVATISDDRTARLWNARSGKQVTVLETHEFGYGTVSFSPDGSKLVTTSDENALIWAVRTGTLLHTLPVESAIAASFSPDGKLCATADFQGSAQLWDSGSGARLFVLEGHSLPLSSVAFSPDGRRLITASHDRTARIWDVESGKLLATLEGHSAPLLSASFSADGSRIATGGDHTARIWDGVSGRLLAVLTGHEADLNSTAFNRQGTHLVTASDDHTARIWDIHVEVRTPEEIDALTRCRIRWTLSGETVVPAPRDPVACPDVDAASRGNRAGDNIK